MWTTKVRSELGILFREVTGGEKQSAGHSSWEEAETVSGERLRKHRHPRLRAAMKLSRNFSLHLSGYPSSQVPLLPGQATVKPG